MTTTAYDTVDKLYQAVKNLNTNAKFVFEGKTVNETTFGTIKWESGDSHTTTNPYSDLTWAAVKAEMDKL